MDTNAALRQQAWRWIRLGVNQKVLAARMGLSESQFSRWLHDPEPRQIPLGAWDGYNKFVEDMRAQASRDLTSLTDDEKKELQAEIKSRQMKTAVRATERRLKATRVVRKRTRRG